MTGFNQRGSRTSEVEVRLAPGPTGDTEFELIHAAVADPHFFPTYGPGAGGVGWDLGLLTLARLLADDEIENLDEFEKSPGGREFSRRSAAAWGQAISPPVAPRSRSRPRSRPRRSSTYPTRPDIPAAVG